MDHDKPSIKEMLEGVIEEMVTGRILWPEALEQFEKLFILKALQVNGGHLSRAARAMGIHRNSLSAKMRKYEIRRSSSARRPARSKDD